MKTFVRALIALVSVLIVGTPALADTNLTVATVRAIEQQMVMPRNAEPLESYFRFYADEQIDDRAAIRGVYLRSPGARWARENGAVPVPGIPGAFTVEAGHLPDFADGGCAVVSIYFDVATQRLLPNVSGSEDAAPELGVFNGYA